MTNCEIGNNGAIALAQMLRENTTIKSIDISDNEIGDEAILALAETFYLASLMNIPIIDSDVVGGRCSPELFLETISLDTNIKRCPLLYITKNGISEIINEADPYKLERFLRLISYNYNSYIYVVGYPMKVKDVFNILNKGSISSSISIGKSTGISNKIKAANAEKIFYGKIFSLEKYDINGFLEGYLKIRGLEDFFGKELKIYFRNENLIAWIDERAVVTCPDLISIIDENNLGISNNDLKQHDNVCVLAIPAINLWKTKKGIELFCPRTFGFNIDYIPINK